MLPPQGCLTRVIARVEAGGSADHVMVLRAHPSAQRVPGSVEAWLERARVAMGAVPAGVLCVHDVVKDGDGGVLVVAELPRGRPLSEALGQAALMQGGPPDFLVALALMAQAATATLRWWQLLRGRGARACVLPAPQDVLVEYGGQVCLMPLPSVEAIGAQMMDRRAMPPDRVAYMPPEPRETPDPEGRTECYCLGVLLHQVLTLSLPFAAGQDNATLTTPPSPRRYNARVPHELDRLCAQALSTHPSQRPTLEAMATQLCELADALNADAAVVRAWMAGLFQQGADGPEAAAFSQLQNTEVLAEAFSELTTNQVDPQRLARVRQALEAEGRTWPGPTLRIPPPAPDRTSDPLPDFSDRTVLDPHTRGALAAQEFTDDATEPERSGEILQRMFISRTAADTVVAARLPHAEVTAPLAQPPAPQRGTRKLWRRLTSPFKKTP